MAEEIKLNLNEKDSKRLQRLNEVMVRAREAWNIGLKLILPDYLREKNIGEETVEIVSADFDKNEFVIKTGG